MTTFPLIEIVEEAGGCQRLVVSGTGKIVGFSYGFDVARLFAASPKLLVALERSLDALNKATDGDAYSEHMNTIAQARTAICEATGVLPDQQRQKEAANV